MRILVIRLSSLGDVMLTQPVVAELRRRFPEAEIVFLTKRQYAALPGLFGLDLRTAVYAPRVGWFLRLFGERFDLVIDLHAKLASWMVKTLVRGTRKASYHKQRSARMRVVKGDQSAGLESTLRLYQSALDKLFPADRITQDPLPHPRLDLSTLHDWEAWLPPRDPDKKLLGVFVGAAHATKMYPVLQWREFLSLAEAEYEFWLLGSQAESGLAEHVRSGFEGTHNLCGRLDLGVLARVLDRCDAVLSGDTGPMHLAAALGRPQIAIFGGTHPRLGFSPLNEKARILCADLDCQPCSLHGLKRCPQGHFNCMRQISPLQIYQTLQALLSN